VLGDVNPEIDHLILENLEVPEERFSDTAVTVPVLILSTRNGVEVKDDV
jgi:hypothetical protein